MDDIPLKSIVRVWHGGMILWSWKMLTYQVSVVSGEQNTMLRPVRLPAKVSFQLTADQKRGSNTVTWIHQDFSLPTLIIFVLWPSGATTTCKQTWSLSGGFLWPESDDLAGRRRSISLSGVGIRAAYRASSAWLGPDWTGSLGQRAYELEGWLGSVRYRTWAGSFISRATKK